ncbi:MAG: hypothetical protein HY465_00030, partial [Deltaproteobacteria bacterium]|nr:hypothetical protein [Deltaproteobacteria bacterium]
VVALVVMGCTNASTGESDAGARTVTGQLASGSGSLSKSHVDGFVADEIIATATDGSTVTAEIEADGSFSLDLVVGKAYVISLVLDDQFVATVIFASRVGFASTALPVSAGGTLNLGTVTISGTMASVADDPFDELDGDGDGEADADDADDDEDGVADEDEEDCDLDGILDDFEETSCEEDDDGALARILEVKPRNDPQPELGDDDVDLDKEPRARASCVLDQTSVSAETFSIVSDSGDEVVCEYTFSGRARSGDTVRCRHAIDFLPSEIYTATISGLLCEDGREIPDVSWSWLTEDADDDDGDTDDEFEDESEADDDDGIDDADDDEGETDDENEEDEDEEEME